MFTFFSDTVIYVHFSGVFFVNFSKYIFIFQVMFQKCVYFLFTKNSNDEKRLFSLFFPSLYWVSSIIEFNYFLWGGEVFGVFKVPFYPFKKNWGSSIYCILSGISAQKLKDFAAKWCFVIVVHPMPLGLGPNLYFPESLVSCDTVTFVGFNLWANRAGRFLWIILYSTVLYCIVLYCIVLYCIVLYCIVLYCIVLYFYCTVV